MKQMDEEYLRTDLKGKIQNLHYFKSEALLPLFEAVVNSINAIEERKKFHDGKIIVQIIRETTTQVRLDQSNDEALKEEKAIIGFKIQDNGIGFTESNYTSFVTSDSTYKLLKGGKGVGRFTWLKAFDDVKINSAYFDQEDNKRIRSFDFTIDGFISNRRDQILESDKTQETTVHLNGFKKKYRTEPSAYKTTEKIAQRILEHCLVYFISKKAPHIVVKDNEVSFDLDVMFNEIENNIMTDNIEIFGNVFTISHVKLYGTYQKEHKIVYCAHNRDVTYEKLDKHLGVSSQFDEDEKKFVYSAYISGDYLDEHVDSSRRYFELPKNYRWREDFPSKRNPRECTKKIQGLFGTISCCC